VQVGLYMFHGVRFGGDSGRYIEAGQMIVHGIMPSGKALGFMGYNLFVAFFMSVGLGLKGIVFGQVLMSGVAALATYFIAMRLYSHRAGFVAALLFICFLDLQNWNFYIYTDSLFVSMTVIALAAILWAKGSWRILVIVPLVLFAVSIRPNGVILLSAWACYLMILAWGAGYRKIVVFILLVTAGAGLLVIDPYLSAQREELVVQYAKGIVIWGYDQISVTDVGAIELLQTDQHVFIALIQYVFAAPVRVLELFFLKIWYLFLHTRPFYSTFHNIAIVLCLVPVYIMAVVELCRYKSWSPDKMLLIAVGAFQMLLVGATYTDWNGRFLLVILPSVFIFASPVLVKISEIVWKRKC